MANKKRVFSALWSVVTARNEQDKISYLRNVDIFKTLNTKELTLLSEIIHERDYQKDEFIFEKGNPGAAMYVVIRGEIEIFSPKPDDNEIIFATLGPGSFFGELALLDDSPRSASARTTMKTEIYAFFREELLRLLEADPMAGAKVYRSLAQLIGTRLRKTNEQLYNS